MIQVNQFKNVLQVFDYFKDEETCKQYLEQKRWGGTVCCPDCGNTKIYRTNRGFRCGIRKCGKKFTVTVGTVMECSKIKLRYWFAAMYLISAHKKGISSHQLARDLGVCQKTAWFLNHRIRKAMSDVKTEGPQLTQQVQIDETYVGARRANMHGWKRQEVVDKYGSTGFGEKTAVVGLLEKHTGIVIAHKIKKADAATLKPIVHARVEIGSVVVTDGLSAYTGLNKRFEHIVVNHQKGEYVLNGFHTNGIENYWSLLKRMIFGTYHHVSEKHIDRYCEEMSYRFNSRTISDRQRFDNIITKTTNPDRLRWNDLVNC